jgi:hypothetical protein
LSCPWITSGIKKSSKTKQRLYVKYLKNRNEENLSTYKQYKNLFEKIGKHSIKIYYSKLLQKTNRDTKKTWNIMKEIIGKKYIKTNSLPDRIIINEIEHNDKNSIAEQFNNFFANIGPNMASKIQTANNSFENYFTDLNSELTFNGLSYEELENAKNSLKINKAPGIDEICSNIVMSIFPIIKKPLFEIFKSSITTGTVPEKLKIAKIVPIYKTGEPYLLNNYRPISILPVFSKLLERIIYNKLYQYITNNNILNTKQFGFQKQHATEHAIVDLVNSINYSFVNKEFVLGIFIDLSKAFDTVDHAILLKKLEKYGVKNVALLWFKIFLLNRQQCVNTDENICSKLLKIKCGVPQGSILAPLLFLIYINDLPKVLNKLDVIMFADDTNLFYSSQSIEELFETTNIELEKLNIWLKSNKLSLNTEKTNYILFHPNQKRKKIPNILPLLKIENKNIERTSITKFLGLLIDENISWKAHIDYLNTKITKNIGVLYKARPMLSQENLKHLYFSFIQTYYTYGNIAWASTNKSNLKSLYRRQKHAVRIVYKKDKFTHAEPLLKLLNALNVYRINIYQNLLFMLKYKLGLVPSHFSNDFFKSNRNRYDTREVGNFNIPFRKTKLSRFTISYRGPYLYNKLISRNAIITKLDNLNCLKILLKKFVLNINNYMNLH